MSLQSRIENLDRFCAQFPSRRICPLVAEMEVPLKQLKELKFAVALYLARSLGLDCDATAEEILIEFHRQGEKAPNSTTSGLLRPYRELTLEANLAFRAYIDVLLGLGIGDLVKRWNVPMIRYKCADAHFDPSLLQRPTQTDHIHMDPWVGEFARSINTMIPLFGDISRNQVELLMPALDFEEGWVRLLPERYTSKEAKVMQETAVPVDYVWRDGHILLIDAATLHRTYRVPGCGPRVSIDTMLSWDDPRPDEVSGRLGIVTTDEFREIGTMRVFYSPDAVDTPGAGGASARDFRLGTVPLKLA